MTDPPLHSRCCRRPNACRHLALRLRRLAGLVVPGAILALLPKCPLCLAAWATALTGLTIPATTAGVLRGTLAALCLASLTIALLCRLVRLARSSSGVARPQ